MMSSDYETTIKASKLDKMKANWIKEGARKTYEEILRLECPVVYYNKQEGKAIPSELIEKRLAVLEKGE